MENRPLVVNNPNTRDRVEPGEKYVLETLSKSPLGGWTIYEQPNLNGDKPDIIMVNPARGVIIIEVKDYQLNSGKYRQGSQVLGNNGKWIHKTNPVDQVQRYRDEILQFCSKYFIDLLEEHNLQRFAFGIIETAVYFHNASAEEGRMFCGFPSPGKAKILDRSHIEAIKSGNWANTGLFTINPNKSSRFSPAQLKHFVNDLETWLKPSGYQLEGARPIKLMPDQEKQAKPAHGVHRRLRGVAGSGKTLILATRAAKLLEEKQRVLVVPYNITLKHYLRDSISRQFTGKNRKDIKNNVVIRHFHDLLKMIAMEYDIKLENPHHSPNEVLTEVWHAQVLNCLKSKDSINDNFLFDAILVDEGQDYCQGWVELLLMLLKERDEFLITYDNVQDIYDRKAVWIEDGTQVKGLGFRGRPAELNITRRVPAPMIKVAKEFAEKYNLSQKNEILVPKQWDDLFVTLQWKNLANTNPFFSSTNPYSNQVLEQVNQFISSGVSPDDITILTTNQETGLDVVQRLKAQKMKVCHVFDESGNKDYKARKAQKWKFQPGTGKIKVSTVHSFKGWESTHLILILDQKVVNSPSLIYVALTRFKHPLDGAESHFVCLNFDPKLNGVVEIFDKYTIASIETEAILIN
ncbi:MAG: NERD domain-containing protein [Bacillota bacterium]